MLWCMVSATDIELTSIHNVKKTSTNSENTARHRTLMSLLAVRPNLVSPLVKGQGTY